MDEKAVRACQEAKRQLERALIYQEQPDCMVDCLQRAQDSIDEARAVLNPPPKKAKTKKDDIVPPGETAMVL